MCLNCFKVHFLTKIVDNLYGVDTDDLKICSVQIAIDFHCKFNSNESSTLLLETLNAFLLEKCAK